VNLEDRTKVGRWLDHVSAQARKVERHQAADRATDALAEHPAQVAGAITLHQAFAAIADALQLAAQPNRQEK
jgi:hypothetical protein